MKKLLLFDFDGVVVDSLDVYEGTVRRCLEKIGQPLIKKRADYLELFEDNFYTSLEKKGVNMDRFMEASTDILAGVNYDEMRPFAKLIPVLAALQAGNILVIVSSSAGPDIGSIMERFQLTGYFQAVLGSDAHLHKKEKILQALETFGLSRSDAYYIGDTVGDIREAKSAGINTIAVTWGWHSREKLLAANPDYLIDQPEELLTILRQAQDERPSTGSG